MARFGVILISLLSLMPRFALADVRALTDFLRQEPASMMDVGLIAIRNWADQALSEATVRKPCPWLVEISVYPRFDSDTNKIIVSMVARCEEGTSMKRLASVAEWMQLMSRDYPLGGLFGHSGAGTPPYEGYDLTELETIIEFSLEVKCPTSGPEWREVKAHWNLKEQVLKWD